VFFFPSFSFRGLGKRFNPCMNTRMGDHTRVEGGHADELPHS